jgi:KDO2-lipid IV(A) lauroyltransferase
MSDARRLPPAKLVSYALQSALLFAVTGALRLFDTDRASRIGGWLGRHLLAPLVRDSRVGRDNLRIAFPAMSDEQAASTLTGMYENLGRVVAEMAHMPAFAGAAGRSRFTFAGLEHLEAARAMGKGMILASGHFANWELTIPVLRQLNLDFSCVARPPNNPWVARWISELRIGMGVNQQIPKGSDGTRTLFATLRRKEPVLMLIDQHLAEGIPVPLFGRDAMTTHAPATFAQKLGLPVLFFGIHRTHDANFEVVFHPPLTIAGSGSEAREVLEMTAALNRLVEAEIRLQPAHWLWMHNRWKPTASMTRRATRMVGGT